jgi:hypothetical protein
MSQTTIRVRDVMAALYGCCDGVIEFRAWSDGGVTRAFAALEDLDAIQAFWHAQRAYNLYWGVATRRDDRDGSLTNCGHLPALFADCDFKLSSEESVRERLCACPLAPSLVIASGGGLQPYWFLKEPADVQAEVSHLRDKLRRLAYWLQADIVAGEPARILRVPGTYNQKYTPPRLVRVEVFEPDRRYNLSEFDWLPSEPARSASQPIDFSKPIGEFRNQSLYRIARALKGKRLPDVIVAGAIRYLNGECCAPPLEDWEVKQIIRNALTQPDRPLAMAPRVIEVC